jgi:hypothetical protein
MHHTLIESRLPRKYKSAITGFSVRCKEAPHCELGIELSRPSTQTSDP